MSEYEEIPLWVFLWREGRKYVAYEPTTGVASQGDTIDEALKNVKEALELYLEDPDTELPYEINKVTVTRINVKIPRRKIVSISHTVKS